MADVSVVHWNPRRPVKLPLVEKSVRIGRRVNNFGDLLGPLVVEKLRPRSRGGMRTNHSQRRLLAVGSIIHLAREDDCIWGSGVNGKVPDSEYAFRNLDVRAVRGPLTRDFLLARGINVTETYGDPGLLLPLLFPWLAEVAGQKRYETTIVPNLNDLSMMGHDSRILDPRSPLKVCLERIARSERVVGSSLHGIIVAESLRIPARLIVSSTENPFKYADYYLGTGRSGYKPAASVEEAIELGGESPISWDSDPLLRAFPSDLWTESVSHESR